MKTDHLSRPDGPWLHVVVASPSDAYDSAWGVQREGHGRVASRVLRGKKMRTWAGLFAEVGAALQFPPYFGENAGALDECLNDLEWLGAEAYVLTILDAARVLDGERPREDRIFWNLLRDTATEWGRPVTEGVHRPARTFHVVAQCAAEEEADLRERLGTL